MNNTTLQVPINKDIRLQATQAASRLGFSSLQETVRVFLVQLINQNLVVTFQPPETVVLSSKAIKRLDEISKDIDENKNLSPAFDSVSQFTKHLKSEN